jgi:hypothetical protein
MARAQDVDEQLRTPVQVKFGRDDEDKVIYVAVQKLGHEIFLTADQASTLAQQIIKKV